MDTRILIAVVVGVLVLAIVVWLFMQKRRTDELRRRYGPEYDRLIREKGDRRRAEAILEQREKRVEQLAIRSLTADERARFAEAWRSDQARFVDDPSRAVAEADRLVADLMMARGYPVGDFEQRAADISVDHPKVVENYRTAHDIALRQQRGEASTEDLRKAMVHYRALFDDLLADERPVSTEVRP
jgi:hypothetical protein